MKRKTAKREKCSPAEYLTAVHVAQGEIAQLEKRIKSLRELIAILEKLSQVEPTVHP